jgi:hypothetical protein
MRKMRYLRGRCKSTTAAVGSESDMAEVEAKQVCLGKSRTQWLRRMVCAGCQMKGSSSRPGVLLLLTFRNVHRLYDVWRTRPESVDHNEETKPSLVSGINKRNVSFKAEAGQFNKRSPSGRRRIPMGLFVTSKGHLRRQLPLYDRCICTLTTLQSIQAATLVAL